MATREGLTRRPGRQPREARPPGRPTPTRVARGRSTLSPPPAAGPAQPSAAQPGATRACLGPNPRSVSARTHRRPCCRLASSAPLLRPAAISTAPRRSPTPLSRPPIRSARPRPRPAFVRRQRRRHGRHRPTPSLEHELVTRDKRRKISSPAGDLRTKYQHTHSKEARDRCSLRITRQAIWCGGPSRARTSGHHAPCKPLTAQPCNTGTRRGRAAEGSNGSADPACYALDAPATRVA